MKMGDSTKKGEEIDNSGKGEGIRRCARAASEEKSVAGNFLHKGESDCREDISGSEEPN